VSSDNRNKKDEYFGFFAGLALLPILFLFIYYRQAGLGRIVFIVVGGNLFALRKYWGLKREVWLWAVVVAAMFAELAVVCSVAWPNDRIPRAGLVLILPVFWLTTGAIAFARKFMAGAGPGAGVES
jgi:hypothetical protein